MSAYKTHIGNLKSLNTDLGLLSLRVFAGLSMLIGHGMGKWIKLFSAEAIEFADPFNLGPTVTLALVVFAEVVCSLLLTIGLLTRWVLVPLIITMLMAAFYIHLNDGFGTMEKALLYAIIYISIYLMGPGRMSLDHLLSKKPL